MRVVRHKPFDGPARLRVCAIARGLIACWPLAQGSGPTLYDACRNSDLTISGATWDADQSGPALLFGGVSDYANGAMSQHLNGETACTLLAVGTPLDVSAGTRGIIDLPHAVGTTGTALYMAAAAAKAFVRTSAGTQDLAVGTLTAGTRYVLGLTYDGVNVVPYRDGIAQTGGALAIGTGIQHLAKTADIGRLYPGPPSYNWSGRLELAAAWKRALTAAEMAELAADPWTMLRD